MTDDVKKVEDTNEAPQATPDEVKAREKGWKPKEEWEGPEDEWKPAKVFNEIGELKERLSEREKDLKKSNKVLTLMKEHHTNVRKVAYEQAIQDLKAQKVQALEADEFAKAEKIKDQIDDIQTRFKNHDELPPQIQKEVEALTQEPDPEFYAFLDRNAWYKPGGKDEMSKEADELGLAFKVANPNASFKELVASVEKKIRKLYPEKFERPNNPVNEGGTRTSSESPKGKVKLTDEQLAIAKGFNMTPEAYAKELDSYRGA
jgi:hypothetical protein